MIGLGIAAVAALGGAKLLGDLEKNKAQMSKASDFLMVEKLIESHLISANGCNDLEGAVVDGPDFEFKTDPRSPVVYGKNKKIGDIEITGLKMKSFKPMDEVVDGAQAGLGEVELRLQKKGSREVVRNIPVSVIVKDDVVQGCDFELTRQFIKIRDDICSRTYALADSLDCDQVIIHLRNLAVEEVCKEVYGSKTPQYIRIGSGLNEIRLCNLALVHAGQSCGSGYIDGFDANGVPSCKPIISFPPPPSCTLWGAWEPPESTVCKDRGFTQSRTCLAGMTATDSQPATGSKVAPECCVESTWTPVVDPATVCSTEKVEEKSNCDTSRLVMDGTKTDGQCCIVSTWTPKKDPATVCTSAKVTEENNCGGKRNEMNGTKSCGGKTCTVYRPYGWGKGCKESVSFRAETWQEGKKQTFYSSYIYGNIGQPGGLYMMEGNITVTCVNGELVESDEDCFKSL